MLDSFVFFSILLSIKLTGARAFSTTESALDYKREREKTFFILMKKL